MCYVMLEGDIKDGAARYDTVFPIDNFYLV